MILKNSLNYLNEFFAYINTQIRKYYLRSKLYNKKILSVVHNSFSLLEMETSQDNKWHIYNGLQEILKPQHKKISAWIKENLTC